MPARRSSRHAAPADDVSTTSTIDNESEVKLRNKGKKLEKSKSKSKDKLSRKSSASIREDASSKESSSATKIPKLKDQIHGQVKSTSRSKLARAFSKTRSRSDDSLRMRGGSSHIIPGLMELEEDLEVSRIPMWIKKFGRTCRNALSSVWDALFNGENFVVFSIVVCYMTILLGMSYFMYRFLESHDFLIKYLT